MSTTEATLAAIATEIPRLRRYARHLARDRDRADDLVQDCLLRAIARLDTWRPGTNLRAWLFAILRNGHISALRSRRRAPLLDVGDELPEFGTPGGHEARVHLQEVAATLGALSAEHREVLHLIALDGLTYDEAATLLGIPVGTVRSRLSRARADLRGRLEAGRGRRGPAVRSPTLAA